MIKQHDLNLTVIAVFCSGVFALAARAYLYAY
jgi:hypothetical protein